MWHFTGALLGALLGEYKNKDAVRIAIYGGALCYRPYYYPFAPTKHKQLTLLLST